MGGNTMYTTDVSFCQCNEYQWSHELPSSPVIGYQTIDFQLAWNKTDYLDSNITFDDMKEVSIFNPIQQNLNDIYYVFEDLLNNCVTEASCPFNMTTDFKQTIMSEVKSYESTVLMGAAVESGVYGLTALLMVIGIACKVGLYLILLAGVFYNVKNGLSFIMSKSSSKNLSNENKHWCFCCLQDKM